MKLSQSKYEVKALNRIDDIYEIVFELQKEKKDGVSASEQQAKISAKWIALSYIRGNRCGKINVCRAFV